MFQGTVAISHDDCSTADEFINEELGDDYIYVPEKLQDGKRLKQKFKPMKKCCYMPCCYPICCCPMSSNNYYKNLNFHNDECYFPCPSCNMYPSRRKFAYCCNAIQWNRCCLPMCCFFILPCCCNQRSSHESSNKRIEEIEISQQAASSRDPNPQPSNISSQIITAKEEDKTAKPPRNVKIMDEKSSLKELIEKFKNRRFKIPLSNPKSRNTVINIEKETNIMKN